MKAIFLRSVLVLLTCILSLSTVFGQSPNSMSYQAVIRNSSDILVTNTTVGMQISILQGSSSGTVVYIETQTPTTNANGLVSIEIGGGTGFDTIHWENDTYFIKTETDPASGTNYTITGTSQLLSVPYALHAKTTESISGGETDPIFGASVASGITGTDTTNWNNKLDSYTETDPSVPTGTQNGEMQYWNGTAWVTVAPGSAGQTLTFVNGVPVWIGTPLTNVVVNPTTGKIWMDRNLGATQVATSITDAASYGDLYQWGRGIDGHQIRTSGTTTTLSNNDNPGHGNFILEPNSPYDWRNPQNEYLWQGVSGTNNPCPSGYRLPTQTEWEAERQSWSSNNPLGAFASPLKLSAAGSRDNISGSLNLVNSGGFYWSSTVNGTSSWYHCFFGFDAGIYSNYRAIGMSVRCIKD